ncbi:N-6 DNA methylase [Streptomyces tailanensis]|uniref:N-6 DNA methylase n=1 Tax=Streptomyces tailanensis TaxID=2569858 RepID=UPI00155AF97B|nr:N-6 DNA methylase [Streptomyces tailanensis]
MTDHAKRPGADGSTTVDVDTVEFAGRLVSRSDIARFAGVKRPAVSNWQRRYPDYPAPASAEPELFMAGEVLAWLSSRTIPVNALLPGEPTGITYGDRFRAGLTGGRAGGLLAAVRELTGPGAERMRGSVPLRLYLDWLLYLVFCAIVEADGGEAGRRGWIQTERDVDLPEQKYPGGLPAALQDRLERNPPRSAEESRRAFDLVLALLRDADAHEGGDFLTPPSVARVMAGALAAVAPAGAVPLDPYCRTGELLTAYLDATAGEGRSGRGPREVRGRVLHDRALRIARMNVRVHGAYGGELAEGPVTPALSPFSDPEASCEVVITNPPFGGRVPDDVSPRYWLYGQARRTEFDWLQYVVSRLAPDGRAAVLMPAGASFNAGASHTVRSGLVEAGAVEGVIELPGGLFTLTGVKTQIWFLRAPGSQGAVDREVLFVAGAHLGHQLARTQWALSDDDIARLVGEYVSWYQAGVAGRSFEGTPGLSRAVPMSEIVEHGHDLDPSRYVRLPGPTSVAPAAGPAEIRDRLARLAEEIATLHARADAAEAEAARWLGRYGL